MPEVVTEALVAVLSGWLPVAFHMGNPTYFSHCRTGRTWLFPVFTDEALNTLFIGESGFELRTTWFKGQGLAIKRKHQQLGDNGRLWKEVEYPRHCQQDT